MRKHTMHPKPSGKGPSRVQLIDLRWLADVSLSQILEKLGPDIKKYLWLRRELSRDVATDVEYQKGFHGFYRLRGRGPGWKQSYFALLQAHKKRRISFSSVDTQIRPLIDTSKAAIN